MGFDLALVAFFFKYNVDMEFTSTFKNEQLHNIKKTNNTEPIKPPNTEPIQNHYRTNT